MLQDDSADDWDDPDGHRAADIDSEGAYVCDNCGEEIVVPLDIAAGSSQQYVEDCPVCCSPSVIHVEWDAEDRPHVRAQSEQDRY